MGTRTARAWYPAAERLVPFAISFAVTCAFVINFCAWMFQCGCRALWAGADAACNIHVLHSRHCPWCSHGTMGYVVIMTLLCAPQLAVSLHCSDPSFAAEAKRRIVARCPIVDDDDFFRGQTRDASAKNLASLLRVLALVQSEARWVVSESSAGDVRELLKRDHDSAAEIAEWWFSAAQATFKESGRDLGAAA